MAARILDGKQIAADMRAEIKQEVEALTAKGVVPGLGVLLVGDDPASRSYVTAKEKACEEAGIYSDEQKLPAEATKEQILDVVKAFNADDKIHGILVQLPLPDGAIEQEVIATIDPLNFRTSTMYDKASRVIAVKDAEDNITTTTYDKAGNIKSILKSLRVWLAKTRVALF